MSAQTVEAPVTAEVGPISVRLAPYEQNTSASPDAEDLPWAVLGLCRVTFRFGSDGLRCTKRITARHRWMTNLGWPDPTQPSEGSVEVAFEFVVDAIRRQIERHGVDASNAVVQREDDS